MIEAQSRMELLALAERVEKATADDAELFYDAFREVSPQPETIWAIPLRACTVEYIEWHQRQTRFNKLAEAGAFIDAAAMLRPEAMPSWRVGSTDDGAGYAELAGNDLHMMAEDTSESYVEAEAATPALALVAACLRSIAAMEGE